MKFILSRKGFDGSTGRMASPIMEDGGLLSLPIPVTKKGEEGISYDELRFGELNLDTIIDELSKGRFNYEKAHLDPDLDEKRYTREKGWRPVFGQTNGAQTYLENRGVVKDEDCLFLFFGWFKDARYDETNELRYVSGARNLHVLFGWLQVGDIHKVGVKQPDKWLIYHPHIQNEGINEYRNNNTIYIASDKLKLFGEPICGKDGGGTFPHFKPSLRLTAKGESMSHWCLPEWLIEGAWKCRDGHLPFLSGGRQQEFVFDVPKENKQKAIDWFKGLFEG